MTERFGGEFRVQLPGRELVLRNQFTIYGVQAVLRSAFHGEAQNWYVALGSVLPGDTIVLSRINEPTVGVGGYAREPVPLGLTDWPIIGNVNGESYVETRQLAFIPSGPGFDEQVSCMVLTDGNYVIAVSSEFEEGLHTVAGPIAVNYRLYFR